MNIDKFKTQLKLAILRIGYRQEQLSTQSSLARREVVDLLLAGKEDQALNKVRYLVRDDYTVEAMEFVAIFCDDIVKSIKLLFSDPNIIDEFLLEQVKSIIYASYRIDIPELFPIREFLLAKFPKILRPDAETGVNPKLVSKLSMRKADDDFCLKYMEVIAAGFGVDWKAPIKPSLSKIPSDLDEMFQCESKDTSRSRIGSESKEKSSKRDDIDPHDSHVPSSHETHESANQQPPSYSEILDLSDEHQNFEFSNPPPPHSPLPMDYSNQQKRNTTQPSVQTTPPKVNFDDLTKRLSFLNKKK